MESQRTPCLLTVLYVYALAHYQLSAGVLPTLK
jgi:hypothetical protein